MRAIAPSHARRLLAGAATVVACLALPVSAQAGRLIATGHDTESHCMRDDIDLRPAACSYVATGIRWVRAGAPDPTKPVLILDRDALDFQKSVDRLVSEGATIPYEVVEPRSPAFATLPIDVGRYSAILIASSKDDPDDPTAQDLNEFGSTPDTDAINARSADIARFFNAGGGIDVMSGGHAGRTNSAKYYSFLKLTRGGAGVQPPFSLATAGRLIGWQDALAFPGERDEINCCVTHMSFELPAPESPLKVAETDRSGRAITLVAETNDLAKIEEPRTTANIVFGGSGLVTGGGGGSSITGTPKPVCVPRKPLKLTLRRPKGIRFAKMVVYRNGRKYRTVSGKTLGTKSRTKAVTITLFKTKVTGLRVVVTTASGRKLTYRQTYKPCPKK